MPNFSENDCWKHFMKTCHMSKPAKVFNLLSWMKQLEKPIKDFNTKPPTYNEINKIIMKMKSSGSSCPIDQVSTLMLKKCPILRTIVIAGKITTSQLNGKIVRQYLFIRRVTQTIHQTLDPLR